MKDIPKTNTEVKTYHQRACCPECSTKPNPGCKLVSCGTMNNTNPPTFLHSCSNCKKEYWLDDVYPRIVYKEMEYPE